MDKFFSPDPLSVGTKGLVYIGSQLLVYRRDDKAPIAKLKIDIPGGGKQDNETPYETFAREVNEEFGLDIYPKSIVYAKRMNSVFEPGKYGWFAVAKLPKTQEGNIKFGDEGLEYMLVSEENYIDSNDAWIIYQERARDYISQYKH